MGKARQAMVDYKPLLERHGKRPDGPSDAMVQAKVFDGVIAHLCHLLILPHWVIIGGVSLL